MKLAFDMPPLTRLLGSTCFLLSGRDNLALLSRDVKKLLDSDVYPGHPAAPVAMYALQWWSNPEEDAVELLSHGNIKACLEYHQTKQIEEVQYLHQDASGSGPYSPSSELHPPLHVDPSLVLPSPSPD